MKNWKTTVLGFLPGLLLIGYKLVSHQPVTVTDITVLLGGVSLGAAAKDADVTGGKRQQ